MLVNGDGGCCNTSNLTKGNKIVKKMENKNVDIYFTVCVDFSFSSFFPLLYGTKSSGIGVVIIVGFVAGFSSSFGASRVVRRL